jgi:predicted nucleic acid-binding protein
VTTPNDSELVLVDSSGWVEFLGEGPKAQAVAPHFVREDLLVVPTVVIYEVWKKLERERAKMLADQFVSQVFGCRVVPLEQQLALTAAIVSLDHKLAMADAIIYATARSSNAELITCDAHFRGLPGVTLL